VGKKKFYRARKKKKTFFKDKGKPLRLAPFPTQEMEGASSEREEGHSYLL